MVSIWMMNKVVFFTSTAITIIVKDSKEIVINWFFHYNIKYQIVMNIYRFVVVNFYSNLIFLLVKNEDAYD